MLTYLLPAFIYIFPPLSWKPVTIVMTVLCILILSSLKHDLECYNSNHLFMWDTASMSFTLLTLFITLLMTLSSIPTMSKTIYSSLFLSMFLSLNLILIAAFSSSNMILFYILFEASLIPTFIIILGFGNQPERTQAGVYMLLYTLLASLPLLLTLLVYSKILNLNMFPCWSFMSKKAPLSALWAFSTLLAFIVKLPLYFTHLWLPKAHVEAPVAGSMILAAVLLKLGGYGIVRLSMIVAHPLNLITPFLLSWALYGGVIAGFICILQTDMKFLIALSSVAHMSLVMASLLTFTSWGLNSALFIMMAHGFCSSALFFIANTTYERTHSRSMLISKGMQLYLPSLTLCWFLLSISNMAAPPSLNLLGEMNAMVAIYPWSPLTSILLSTLVFLSAAYSLYLYSATQHARPSSFVFSFKPPSLREFLIVMLHWAPLNLSILHPLMFQFSPYFSNLY